MPAEPSSSPDVAPAQQIDASSSATEASTLSHGEAAAPSTSAGTEAQEAAQTGPGQAEAPSPASEAAGPAEEEDPEERSRRLQLAERHKQTGNEHYRAGRYDDALRDYQDAVQAAPPDAAEQVAVYWANAAACHLQLDRAVDCVHCCSASLEHNPAYLKALLRRSAAYEKLDELDKALKDAKQALECEPGCAPAAAAVQRLQPVVDERNERLKAETMDKLKDLGNTLLGKFGLSLDSFQAERDPSTGSYSIKFNNS